MDALLEQPGDGAAGPVEIGIEGDFRVCAQSAIRQSGQWHFHRRFELHLVGESAGSLIVGDHRDQYAEGDLVLIGPGLPHAWHLHPQQSETAARHIQVHFSETLLRSGNQLAPDLLGLEAFMEGARAGLAFGGKTRQQAAEMMHQLLDAQGCKRLAIFYLLLDLLAGCSQSTRLVSAAYPRVASSGISPRIKSVMDYLCRHYSEPVIQDRIAEEFGMSAGHLCRRFKKETGVGFVEFINHLRVQKSCELLANSGLPITQICFEVGFRNISNFNRRFVALKKMTPSAYRCSYRADSSSR
ncbi:helix-turn-helix transcriptional regulator [Motiliproteus coralliicola]|uniref:helix-turn-helix transcriptional regulator n=1 Tax=Motiliproteus coralliicola TaxID=2283196 RepID=UPI0014033470|nr:AraC family transcriptional regulator [Motiliproteus coralliicola]